MEVKKSPKADLRRWRGVFIEAGLVIALLVCIMAFNVSQKDKVIVLDDLGGLADEIEVIDITVEQEKPKVEPVKQTVALITDVLNVVKNDAQITTTFSFSEFEDDDINVAIFDLGPEEIEEEAPLIIAEEMPTFQGGGLDVFRNWVQKNYEYPQIAADNGIQGMVMVFFVVEKDGTISNIQVVQSPDPLLSAEAVRVIAQSPKWTPGKQRNVPVRVQYQLPLNLRISN